LRHRAKRRFENRAAQPLNDLRDPHATLGSISK
jgi:hypothetical protein